MNLDICMVGSAMTDLALRTPRLPRPGETLLGSSFTEGFGGKGANQAVMAARLGARVGVVVKLGRDAFGDRTLEHLRNEGLDTSFVGRTDGPSGVALITVGEDTGENAIALAPGANLTLSPDDVARAAAAVRGAAVIAAQLETPQAATLAAFRLAKGGRARTLLNPAPAAELDADLLALTDVLIPNENEAGLLLGRRLEGPGDAESAAVALLERGPETVLLTLGSRGVLLAERGGRPRHVRAEAVRAVDTTGAGDAFVGSLAYFLACRPTLPLEAAASLACRLASLSVTRPGTQSSYPRRSEVADLLGD